MQLFLQISDFGISKILKDGQHYEQDNNLPVDWSSPEARKGHITSAADVWSYAVVLWEVYSDGVVSILYSVPSVLV